GFTGSSGKMGRAGLPSTFLTPTRATSSRGRPCRSAPNRCGRKRRTGNRESCGNGPCWPAWHSCCSSGTSTTGGYSYNRFRCSVVAFEPNAAHPTRRTPPMPDAPQKSPLVSVLESKLPQRQPLAEYKHFVRDQHDGPAGAL